MYTIIGFERGITILVKIVNWDAPSSFADSLNETGIVSKNSTIYAPYRAFLLQYNEQYGSDNLQLLYADDDADDAKSPIYATDATDDDEYGSTTNDDEYGSTDDGPRDAEYD